MQDYIKKMEHVSSCKPHKRLTRNCCLDVSLALGVQSYMNNPTFFELCCKLSIHLSKNMDVNEMAFTINPFLASHPKSSSYIKKPKMSQGEYYGHDHRGTEQLHP